VETNTLYEGDRSTIAEHRETIKINGWDFCLVDMKEKKIGNGRSVLSTL